MCVLGGLLLTYDPTMMQRLAGFLPDVFTHPHTARTVGFICLAFVGLYVAGSLMHFRPFRFGRFEILYPRPDIMLRQLFAAPLELIGAAGIIYFALPEQGNPGYIVVLGAFLLSFSAALMSHAPGGLGVFELVFINLMPDVPRLAGAGGASRLAPVLSDHPAARGARRGGAVRTSEARRQIAGGRSPRGRGPAASVRR